MRRENKKFNLSTIILIIVIIVIAIIGVILFTINRNEYNGIWSIGKIYNIGDTTSNSNFEVTLKNVEFTDKINLNYTTNSYGGADFCLPTTETNSSYVLTSKEDTIFLSYILEYKYIGKNDYSGTDDNIGKPTLTFDKDYTYSKNFMTAVKKGKDNDNWTVLSSDISGNDKILHSSNNYRPLEDKTYVVRGFISVPAKLKNSDNSLTIEFQTLSNNKFKIR